MGAPYTTCIAMARAPITASMKGKFVGEIVERKNANRAMLNSLGFPPDKEPDTLTMGEAFVEYDALKHKLPDQEIPPSTVGVYTYFASKLGIGLKQLFAGVRKFKLDLLCRDEIACISQRAIDLCNHWELGIKSQEELDLEQVKKEIYSGNY